VLMIVAITKFTSGAWLPVAVIPLIVVLLKAIKRHYTHVADALRVAPDFRPARRRHTAVILSESVHVGVLEAIAYARATSPDHMLAMTVVPDGVAAERIEKEWARQGIDVSLEVVVSPSRSLTAATLAFIDEVGARWDNDIVTVVIPEFYVDHWWQHVLHNQSALLLKGRLLFRKETVVTSIPYRLEPGRSVEEVAGLDGEPGATVGSAEASTAPIRSAVPDS
jgi:hypothetical protein